MKVDVYEVTASGHPDDNYSATYLQRLLKGVAVVHYVTPNYGFRLVIHKNRNFKGDNRKFEETVLKKLSRSGYLLQYMSIEYLGKKQNHKYVV